ncbi:MAG TPA: BtrH N-terminal domain-containing protein [Desulfobacterales bacterium]|nr:BtrH N-terminal domain-containing protein [Desulfobacterales bacterium]
MKIKFKHRQSSHCESGVTSNLLYHYGVDVSEAMAFGIGGGLFFGYLPFLKVNKLPLTTYRCALGGIIKRTTKKFGIDVKWQKFTKPAKGMDALDALLDQGIPTGCRTGGYWLPYFPPAFRFHFNMHNLVVYGKDGGDYLISDPVFPDTVVCPGKDLMKARFAKGPLAPKGTMYYLSHVPHTIDVAAGIVKGIKSVGRAMLNTPGPFIGISGMRLLAKQLEKWPEKLGQRQAALYLGQVIRLQEEIGTGGAGFRFMYAAFLQEAAHVLGDDRLLEIPNKMTDIGDQWRYFALVGSRICKGRASKDETYPALANILRDCAHREKELYRELLMIVR